MPCRRGTWQGERGGSGTSNRYVACTFSRWDIEIDKDQYRQQDDSGATRTWWPQKYQLKLPAEFPNQYEASDVTPLATRFKDMALTTATKLDQRNGNSYYTSFIEQL